MTKKILIYGGGGHAKTVIDMIRAIRFPEPWNIAGIVDTRLPKDTLMHGIPVLGDDDVLPLLYQQGIHAIVNTIGGIGNFRIRKDAFDRLQEIGFEFPTLIHPSAVIEPSVSLADGVQILAMCYLSSDSSVGFGTLINAGVILSHDCHIGDVVNLSPGAVLAGNVTVESYAQIGMGVTINRGVTIGSEARVGNSAAVKEDVPAHGRVYAGQIWLEHRMNPRVDPKNLRKIA